MCKVFKSPCNIENTFVLLTLLTSWQVFMEFVTHSLMAGKKGTFLYSAIYNPQDCSRLYSLADLFNLTPSRLLWEVSSHAAFNAQRLYTKINHCLQPCTHSYSHVNWCNIE